MTSGQCTLAPPASCLEAPLLLLAPSTINLQIMPLMYPTSGAGLRGQVAREDKALGRAEVQSQARPPLLNTWEARPGSDPQPTALHPPLPAGSMPSPALPVSTVHLWDPPCPVQHPSQAWPLPLRERPSSVQPTLRSDLIVSADWQGSEVPNPGRDTLGCPPTPMPRLQTQAARESWVAMASPHLPSGGQRSGLTHGPQPSSAHG